MDLFGESITEPPTAILPVETRTEEVSILTSPDRFPNLNSESRIIKFPSSSISVQFSDEKTSSAVNKIQCRLGEDGASIESNARLVEWEDGSWTLIVGSEHFRIIERDEDVSLFDQQPSGYQVSVGSVSKQFNVIPGSLDSRTHRHVVEQSAVQRKLTESRKVALAHGFAGTLSGNVNTRAVHPSSPERVTGGQKLTAEFLEAGLAGPKRPVARQTGGVRDIKASYKRTRRSQDEEESDVEAPSLGSDTDSSLSSDDESDSSESSGSSSDDSSSSDSDSSSSD